MEAAVAAATAAAKAAAAVSAAAAAPVWREAQQNAARIGFHEGKYLLQDRLRILVAVSSASNLIQALNDELRGENNTKQPTSVYSWSGTCGFDPRLTKHGCHAPPVMLIPPYDYVFEGVDAGSHLAVAEKPHRDIQPFFGAGLHLRARVSTRIASAAQHTAAQHAHQHCRVIREQTLVVVLFTTD